MKKITDFLHHLLIPKEENNYRAKALHTDFLTYYLVIALFLTFTFKQLGLSNVLGFATDITVDKLYQLTNQQREKNSLPDLTYNDKLSAAAAKKAADMFAKNYWAHYGPDGETPWDFIMGSGYSYEFAGENLASDTDAHYAGKGISFGTKDTPIFWYRPKDGKKYRVIYADLSVREADAPPHVPKAQPAPRPSTPK